MRFFFLAFMILLESEMFAQVFTGQWYGRAEANTAQTYNTYLCELDIKKKGNLISGNLHYYFGPYEFTTPVTGKFWPATKTIELNPFPLITYFSRQQNDADCIMDGSLTLYTDGGDTTLYGQLNPVHKYRLGCPLMVISLKKTSEGDAIPIEQPEYGADSTISTTTSNDEPVALSGQEKALLQRSFQEGRLIEVENDEVEMLLYDNADIDMDTVSVFLNRKLIVNKQLLGSNPKPVKLKLNPGENEIAMFAENLGEIPPNTALCIIVDGENRYTINLSSTLSSNGTIRIRKKIPSQH